jgi:hypothetical protein
MQVSLLLTRAGVLLASSVLVACSADGPIKGASADEAQAMLLAHTPPGQRRAATDNGTLSSPAYTQLAGASATATNGSLALSVTSTGSIPRLPDAFTESVAVFGYAWVDLDTGLGIVAVIHPAIGRDSRQNPNGWHTHPVQLAQGTATSDFCIVSIGRSQAGIAIQGGALSVRMAEQWAPVSASALDAAAAFVVQLDADCAATGLGVAVQSAVGL